ncbi:MAG: DNA polymerase III subunit chi [Pseudomonadota bacterium]
MEVHFYQLWSSPLPRVIYDLSTRCLDHGWRVNIVAPKQVAAIDTALWTFDDMVFFPHGTESDDRASEQTVVLSDEPTQVNQAQALILAGMADISSKTVAGFERVCVIFSGQNPDELGNARTGWKQITGDGHIAKYWSQESGAWDLKASSDGG